MDYSFSNAVNIFPSILGELNCEVVALNAYMDEKHLTKTGAKFQESMEKIAEMVKTLKADAGIVIDAGGQKIFIVDDKGKILSDDDGLIAMSMLFLNCNKGKTIAVPVNVTAAMEKVAADAGGRMFRTGTSYRSMMTAAKSGKAAFVAEEKGGYIFSEFQPAFDAMMSTVKFLEYLARLGGPMSEITAAIPGYIKVMEEEPLPWEKRGAVMKELVALSAAKEDNIEGIEFKDGGNRVLIIPDNDRPVFRIYSEGATKAAVKGQVAKYRKMVKKIVDKI
jgi:mannose-1-phosphate guanylyltransferase/phosphomannomutase